MATLGGWHYYITFTNDHSQLTYLSSLRQKSSTFDAYQAFEAWLDQQLAAKVKLLHSNRGGEYQGRKFILYLECQGTAQRFTAHNTPQHNSVAKRLNQMILERVRALLHASSLPNFLWGEAARHIVWLKNQTPTKVLGGLTPYEVAFGKRPDLGDVWEWGSNIYVRVEGESKLHGRVEQCKWMGIDDKLLNAYHVYWPRKRSITIERNVSWQPRAPHIIEGEDDKIQVPDAVITHIPVPSLLKSSPATNSMPPLASTPQPLLPLTDPHPQCAH